MKHFVKTLCLASLFAAGFSAEAQTLDKLNIAQINPDLFTSFNRAGSVVTFYDEDYVVDAPQICHGPDFNKTCQVTLSHLTGGVTYKINQQVVNGVLVVTMTAHPDGKKYLVTYHQKRPHTVMSVLNVKALGNN